MLSKASALDTTLSTLEAGTEGLTNDQLDEGAIASRALFRRACDNDENKRVCRNAYKLWIKWQVAANNYPGSTTKTDESVLMEMRNDIANEAYNLYLEHSCKGPGHHNDLDIRDLAETLDDFLSLTNKNEDTKNETVA